MAGIEIERTYEPADGVPRPDLSGLPGVARTVETGTRELVAVYFDTPDSALLRAGVTLRRRTGGDDQGWHLKVSAADGGAEEHLPLSRALHMPPKPLREAVLGWTRGTGLQAVARLTTRRTAADLLDTGGTVLARFADAVVEGVSHLADHPASVSWREWELELDEGGPKLLAAADALLAADSTPADADMSDHGIKLERVLGPPVPPRPELPRPKKGRPARLVVHTRIAEQVAELARRDCEIRRGESEGLHQARVACRRLRGALATFRPVFDEEVTEPIRAELRWVARALGDARDLDVVADRLREMVDDVPADLVIGPVRRRIDRSLGPRRKAAYAGAREVLASERYFALRAQLDRLAAAPPWATRAEEDARDVLPQRLDKELKRVRRRVRRAERSADPADRDEAVHAARRAAKRLRYAAEALRPVWGKEAKAVVTAAKRMTSALGTRQDAVVTMPELVALARQADRAGESAFTYGLLHGDERRLVSDIDDCLPGLFREVEKAVQRLTR